MPPDQQRVLSQLYLISVQDPDMALISFRELQAAANLYAVRPRSLHVCCAVLRCESCVLRRGELGFWRGLAMFCLLTCARATLARGLWSPRGHTYRILEVKRSDASFSHSSLPCHQKLQHDSCEKHYVAHRLVNTYVGSTRQMRKTPSQNCGVSQGCLSLLYCQLLGNPSTRAFWQVFSKAVVTSCSSWTRNSGCSSKFPPPIPLPAPFGLSSSPSY